MTTTTRLVITRHGEAHCNTAGRVGGERTCTGLTERGRAQVHRLADRLAAEHRTGRPFDALYAGPRLRLQESGRILSAALGLPLTTDPGLDGPRHGQADGLLWHDVEAAFGGHPSTHPDQPWAPDSDTWNGYLRRSTDHLYHFLAQNRGKHLLLAAHGETVHAACHALLRISPDAAPHIDFGTDHACLTRFELRHDAYGHQAWKLSTLNDTGHLAPC